MPKIATVTLNSGILLLLGIASNKLLTRISVPVQLLAECVGGVRHRLCGRPCVGAHSRLDPTSSGSISEG